MPRSSGTGGLITFTICGFLIVAIGVIACVAIGYAVSDHNKIKSQQAELKEQDARIQALEEMLSEEDFSGGSVALSMSNSGESKRSVEMAPDYLGLKFIAAYLAEDIDEDQSNIGQTAIFYLNPECNDDIANCNVDGTATHQIETFFNLSTTTFEVNGQLNAQTRPVPSGHYRFVRLEFCKYNTGAYPNIQFKAGNMTSVYGFSVSMCTITAEIPDTLTVEDGTVVLIDLAYDLAGTIVVQDQYSGSASCTNSTPSYCLNIPTLTPSVVF